jgi:hypothetical protein
MFAANKEAVNGTRRLRKDVRAVETDLSGIAHAVGEQVRDYIETALGSAGDGIAVAKETLYDASGTVAKRIRKKPVESALIALGVGALLGALLRR